MDDPDGQRFGLAQITLADRPHFDRAFAALKQPITDYSFASTFVWSSSLKLYWARIDQHLCLFANGTGDLTMLMPPIPEPGAREGSLRDALGNCFEVMDAYNARHADRTHSRIEYVSDEMLEMISGVRGFTLSATPMSGDYVYDMARMIDLAGGGLKSKRHARSKFMRLYPDHRTEPLDESHVPACLALLDLWHQNGDASHDGEVNDAHIGSDILRHRETTSCHMALEHWRTLGLRAMSLFVGDKLIGFTLGEALSPTQASILIEKTHPDYDGAAQFIFSEFCRQYWAEFPECNAGDDWGIPSLRFTKESYRPVRLLAKNVLTRQAPVVVGSPAIDMPVEHATHSVANAAGDLAPAGSAAAESE
ncbi:MAG: phosphatidylglycerol lysyltransferase domain-containing protein, partial [Planctomycetota bacterium]|nr:phosphatidylglycerol lysyltransferase domain-containing protein [Planctomycetota bacterium]